MKITKKFKFFNFGKVDGYGNGRKTCAVEVEIRLGEDRDGKPTFSASADVWNNLHTDTIMGGQCLDELVKYPSIGNNKIFNEILDLWHKYHLNDLTPGTPEQMSCLAEHKNEIDETLGFYTKELKLLEKYGLDVVEYKGKPYKYGTAWLTTEIPQADLQRIQALFND